MQKLRAKKDPTYLYQNVYFMSKKYCSKLHITLKMSRFVGLPFSLVNVDHSKDHALMMEGQCSSLPSTWGT